MTATGANVPVDPAVPTETDPKWFEPGNVATLTAEDENGHVGLRINFYGVQQRHDPWQDILDQAAGVCDFMAEEFEGFQFTLVNPGHDGTLVYEGDKKWSNVD